MVNLLDKHKHPWTIPQPKQSPTPQRGAEHRTPVPNRSTVTGTHINSNHTVPITVHTVTVSFQSWPLPPCSPRLSVSDGVGCRWSVYGCLYPVRTPPSPPRGGGPWYIYTGFPTFFVQFAKRTGTGFAVSGVTDIVADFSVRFGMFFFFMSAYSTVVCLLFLCLILSAILRHSLNPVSGAREPQRGCRALVLQ